MIVSDTAVLRRISVLVLAVIILTFGIYCYQVIPRESDPDITIPNVFISTSYKGVSSSDIETSITIQIEKKLKGLEGVKKISSVSSEGLSSINIEFIAGTDIDSSLRKVKDKVDEAKGDLPSDLEDDPVVSEVNISEMPIAIYSLSGSCGIVCLKEIGDNLEDEIETVKGILDVEVTGGLEREIRIEVIPERLAYYGIPITDIQRVLAGENINTSGGIIRLGEGRFQLRVPGEFRTPEEIFNLVVSTHDGEPVYLKELAGVIDGFKDESGRSRLNGMEAITLSVKKRAGENIIAISEQIDTIIKDESSTWPGGTKITKLIDKSRDIKMMVADLENNILSGLILVVIVILFAMGLKNAILVSLAIPFSMFLSFIVLYLLGITLNIVVLFSLTLALGMLVDNAIVIIENIYRFMEQGVNRVQAAMKATSEVAYPVIASTITTLSAFFPMIFWPGIMGEFMKYLPITLIVTLTSSLFTGLVINPALAAMFIKKKAGIKTKEPLYSEDVLYLGESPKEIKGPFLLFYTRFMKSVLHHPVAVILASFAVLIIMIQIWLLRTGLERPIEFFPNIDPKSMYVNVISPEGASLDYIDRILKRIEILIAGSEIDNRKSVDEVYENSYTFTTHPKRGGGDFKGPSDLGNIKYVYSKGVITSGGASIFDNNSPNHIGVSFIDLEDRLISSSETIKKISERIKDIAGVEINVTGQEEGPPTGDPINIEISGEDFRVLGKIAKEIRRIVSTIPFIKNLRDDYAEGIPSVIIDVDRKKAALFGISSGDLGFILKTGYNGLKASTFREGDDDYDITVQLSESDREVTDILRELMIPAPSGVIVPLTTIADIRYAGSLGDITRVNHKRVVTVKAGVDETAIPGPVVRQQAEEMLKELHLPPGYRAEFTGELEEQKESEDFLKRAFVIALFLIFLILVTQFNSISQPFIIMTSVILSLGGAFLGLTVINSPFGIIMTGVGVISLAGVVVNNAIVLIDYTNKLIKRGMEVKEAIIAAGATRLRPVILTAITTVLGLLPMVTGVSFDFHKLAISWVSESTQWWRSMAIVVIFGLITATFLTLVVVPTLYSLFHSVSGWIGKFMSGNEEL